MINVGFNGRKSDSIFNVSNFDFNNLNTKPIFLPKLTYSVVIIIL